MGGTGFESHQAVTRGDRGKENSSVINARNLFQTFCANLIQRHAVSFTAQFGRTFPRYSPFGPLSQRAGGRESGRRNILGALRPVVWITVLKGRAGLQGDRFFGVNSHPRAAG